MTYNFDPDKWYEDEVFMIQAQLKTGKITQNDYDLALSKLEQKL